MVKRIVKKEQAVTKMPRSCVCFPCSETPEKAILEKDENGFTKCPLCKCSYGNPKPHNLVKSKKPYNPDDYPLNHGTVTDKRDLRRGER